MIQKNDIKNIPSETGVYLFRRRRTPLYIGKSINLKARLASHLADSKISAKEARIVRESDNVVYKTTLSDFDAILLESKLIKKYRPKYNVILKDDKHYIYIKITVKDRYPKVFAVRKENDNKSLYFGPFYSARVTRGLIREIRRVIPLCTTTRVTSRPCFYSKIGLCNPCPNVIEHHPDSKIKKLLYKKYKKNIRSVISLLSGKSIRLFTRLKRSIQKEVKKEHYEEALIIRDKLYSFDKLLSRQQFGSGYEALHLPDPSLLHKQLSKLLKDQFGVKRLPRRFRIECYDISNIFGDYAA
ncbi:MAG: GIY-YIG nuclease family protein, partial [Candidatus Paceibacterota bacterium]